MNIGEYGENNTIYEALTASNLARQQHMTESLVMAHLSLKIPILSLEVIKTLNYLAVACLSNNPGIYRTLQVSIGKGTEREFLPMDFDRIPTQMHMLVNQVNRHWESTSGVYLAAWVLWRLNYIHPFTNGNGRTARAAAYFCLCMKAEQCLPGKVKLPALIEANREEYYAGLRAADSSVKNGGAVELTNLTDLLTRLINEQVASSAPDDCALIAGVSEATGRSVPTFFQTSPR